MASKTETNPKGAGRPKKPIDEKLVYELAKIHATMKEIAAACDCSVDTLERNFADLIHKGKDEGRITLRRMQWNAAQRGNVTMMLWLGKQILDQTEKVTQTTHLDAKIDSTNELDKAQAQLVETIAASLESKNANKG